MNIGDMTEGAIFGALVRRGASVLIPFGQNQAYDLVVDRGEAGFVRVQCKAGWERNGCVEFNSASTDHGHGHRHYRGRAELFAVFVPALDQIYIVPVDGAPSRRTVLRLRPTANHQTRRVRLAEHYLLERFDDQLLPAPSKPVAV